VEAADNMGNFFNEEPWVVKVDKEPPEVALDDFYFSRGTPDKVNGKFDFIISAQDINGIGPSKDKQAGDEVYIKWWIRNSETVPNWNDTLSPPVGINGQFKTGDDTSGGRYRVIINSSTVNSSYLNNGKYYLYAAAEDFAENQSVPKLLQIFTIDRESDYPVVDAGEQSPNNDIKQKADLKITGKVTDDDGFTGHTANTVQIRFRTAADNTTWENAWTNVPATLDPTGALTFEYVIPNSMKTGVGYFADDGLKEYQIRVTDIQANKNPTANTVLNNAVIAAVSKIYPADNTGYSFILKDKKPEIFFASYDENDEKDENDDYTHEYSATRPVFRDRDALLTALNGGYVKDRYLASVTVSYDRGTTVELLGADEQGAYTAGNLTPPLTEGTAEFKWNLRAAGIAAWLPVEASITEGMHTIIITARDLAGGTTSAEWKFYKDITGPVITANITKGNAGDAIKDLPVVAGLPVDGVPAALLIKGRFDDEYSPIDIDITSDNRSIYWFDGDTSMKYDMGISGETNNNKTVNWTITIPSYLLDGRHRFTLTVCDAVGNPSNLTDWYFVVDRKDPEVTPTDEMTVSGNLGAGFSPGPITDVNSRVFSAASVSAASTAVIFTLEGYAWDDSNLNSVSVSLRRGSVTNDVAVTAAPENMALTFRVDLPTVWSETADGYSQQSADADSQHRLTVTKDTTKDRWKWSLNVLSKDLFTLKTGYTNGESCFVSVNARDVAQFNSELQHWRFSLDTTAPVPEFSNIVLPNSSATPPVLPTVFEGDEVTMSGTVSDDNRVKTIRYYLQKFNYANNTWLRCASGANGTWSAGTPEWSTYTFTQTSLVTWTLDGKTLERGRYGSGSDNLFAGNNGQGRYQLTIEAADFSLAASNAGNAQSLTREFYVDRADPAINWTGTSANQTAFRNKTVGSLNGIIELTLTASDVNYIAAAMTVEIKGPPTNAVVYTRNYTYPAADTQIIATAPTLSDGLWSQNITLRPQVKAGSTWDPGRYTLTLTIRDRAGKSASINHTREFEVHNTAPSITINDRTGASPVAVNEAIVGRTPLRGEFTAKGSPVAFVAYYVSQNGAATAPALNSLAADTDLDYTSQAGRTALAAAGWRFDDGTNNNLRVGNVNLMTIGSGLTNVTMLLPDTSSLINSSPRYAGTNDTTTAGATFEGVNITGKVKNQLRIFFLAVDEAGNRNIVRYDYWIYPEGDKPTVTVSRPDETEKEERRLLNGRIRIGGTAKDNVRVKNVWFRILDESNHPIIDRVQIPVWDALWDAVPNTYQNNTQAGSKQITKALSGSASNDTYGWFMANGGGKAEVPWYAYINTNGELDPLLEGSRKITVEVLAEDTMQDEDGNWYSSDNFHLYSSLKAPKATIVKGAPEFSDVRIRRSASGINTTTSGRITTNSTFFDDKNVWVPLESANIRGRASYSVTVTHEAGLKEIMYTPTGGNPINLLPEYDDSINDLKYADYNTTTYTADLNAVDNETTNGKGVAVKAGPKATLTGSVSLTAGTTYLIWVWDDELKNLGLVPADSPNAADTPSAKKVMRFTTFTPATTGTRDIKNAELIAGRQVTENGQTKIKFDWVVVVDVHANLIEGSKYKTGYLLNGVTVKSGRSPLTLRATENSQSVALYTDFPAELPIDNDPPRANYTHNSYVAGEAATVGGEAGDTGPVNGLDKVVLWFSRDDGAGEKSISWNGGTFVGGGANPGITIQSSTVTIPYDYAESATSGNNSSIVIKYNDPLGQNARFGHKLPIGFATVGGDLSQVWYVTLDSTKITSGRITAHYIVYDKAGNVTYYTKKLIVMNGVPRISRITLATDIRGDKGLTGTGGSFTANGSYGLNRNDSVTSITTSPMTTIRDKFTSGTDIQRGISDYIAVDTDSASKQKDYGVVYDEPFNVRNNLLAVQVEVPQDKGDGGKDRTFRVEYVSGGTRLSDTSSATTSATTNGNGFYKTMKAGRIYMIENPGSSRFPWGSLGLQGDSPRRGVAFMAVENGNDVDIEVLDYRANNVGPSVWELNSYYYNNTSNSLDRNRVPTALQLSDVRYNSTAHTTEGKSAEFVYAANAFDQTQFSNGENISATSKIHDFTPTVGTDGRPTTYPYVADRPPWEVHSLFIVKVFGGLESELFGDFALLSIRVNNDDRTRPYAQLYDLNPKTEGQDNTQNLEQALSMSIGSNRTKGGLWNTGTVQKIEKSGHIEPRRGTNLTSAQMGGAANDRQASITKPFIAENDKATKLFAVDTVSGDVILRGYVEDDQRIVQVVLNFNGTGVSADGTPTGGINVTILQRGAGFDLAPPAAITNRVGWTETVDLNRHRVEWAYLWKTEETPGGNNVVATGMNVYAIALNANAALAAKTRSLSVDETAANTTYNYFNEDYPANFKRYNRIPVNLRPYITGFKRNQQLFAHNTRSRQGWYMFARNETAVVTGFNLLNGTGNTVINLQGMGNYTTTNVGTLSDYGVTAGTADDDNRHYRLFVVSNTANTAATTGNGVITLTVNGLQAVNTGNGTAANSERAVTITAATQTNSATARPTYILPWNIERSPGTDGSDLWDDFTQAHIWQSNDTAPGSTQDDAAATSGRFASVNRYVILSPAMSIDAASGILWESHNEGGSGYLQNSGTARRTAITTAAATSGNNTSNNDVVMQFVDPIFFSDVYRSPGTASNAAATWTVSSIIGRSGDYNNWRSLGGIYINGPGGGDISFAGGGNGGTSAEANTFSHNLYHGESTWYNASSQNTARTNGNNKGGLADPPSTDQFMNPHIVTSYNAAGTEEHIHVSYYDDKDGSLKYRHNLRGSPDGLDIGAFTNTNNTDSTTANQRIPKLWTNLDGGLDLEDSDATGDAATWTLNQATRGTGIATAANRYLRSFSVQNNATVTAGQAICVLGTNAATPGNTTTIYAPISGTISNLRATSTTQQTANTDILFTITPAAANRFTLGQRVVNYTTRNGLTETQRIKAGKHNSIAVTSQGYPVIAYYDQTNQRLKLAVSGSLAPIQNTDWVIRDYVIPSSELSSFGTGEFVSMKIDTRNNADIVHIAAMNTAKRLVYVTGQLNPPNAGSGNTEQTSGGVLTNVKVQVVDSVGTVGRWCSLSLDSNGNPWISYMDESYVGARDGAKVAYLNKTTFYKGVNTGTDAAPAGYFPKEYIDLYGASLEGWETMHVPTTYRVENPVEGPGREHGRLKIECYPTRNYTGTPNPANRFWGAAVSYLSQDADSANAAMDRYRVAYYVK
jgi:hypothetical protein